MNNVSTNKVVSTMMDHRSYRNYSDQPIQEKDIDTIIRSAQAAPSWANGQHVTIISIKDKERRKKFAEICGNQKHITEASVFLVFCADFHRVKLACEEEGEEFAASENIDLLLVGATDVGISLSNAINAAESLGLGTVPIGGIRRRPLEVIELLHLPKFVIPISGLCIGYPSKQNKQKPRLPKNAIYHEEQYNDNFLEILDDYNQIYNNYMNERKATKTDANWSQGMANFYSKPYYANNTYPDVRKMLEQQGFAIGNSSK